MPSYIDENMNRLKKSELVIPETGKPALSTSVLYILSRLQIQLGRASDFVFALHARQPLTCLRCSDFL